MLPRGSCRSATTRTSPAADVAPSSGLLSITQADVDTSAREALVVGLHHQHTKRWAELAAEPEVQRALADHARDGTAAPRSLYDALQEHGLFDGLAWTVDPAFVMWVRARETG